jgi:hypothetical protein
MALPSKHILIVASGVHYQEAAAWSAPTYSIFEDGTRTTVLLPNAEAVAPILRQHASQYNLSIVHFPLSLISQEKYASQLKCQGFLHGLALSCDTDVILFADADTCCLRPPPISPAIVDELRAGRIGLVPDVADRHEKNSAVPWYLRPEEQRPYVNSGVILTSRKAFDVFSKFADLSAQPAFLQGPYHDQKVINYAIGKYFPDRLFLLERCFNGMKAYFDEDSVIWHCSGGVGKFGPNDRGRKAEHQRFCQRVLAKHA